MTAPCNKINSEFALCSCSFEACFNVTSTYILFSKFSVLSYFAGQVHNLWQDLPEKNNKRVKPRVKPFLHNTKKKTGEINLNRRSSSKATYSRGKSTQGIRSTIAVITSFEVKKTKYMHYLTLTPLLAIFQVKLNYNSIILVLIPISRACMANENQLEKWQVPKFEGKISPICQESIAWNWLNWLN